MWFRQLVVVYIVWFRHSRSVPLGTEWWTTVVRGPCNLWRSSPWTCTSGRMSWTKNDFHRDRSKMEEFLDHRRYCYTMNFSGWQSQFSRSWQPGSLYLAWVIWIKLHICELLLSVNWSKNGTKPIWDLCQDWFLNFCRQPLVWN